MVLIQNNLHHIVWELEHCEPCIFRVAKESHQLLTRMMVEALCGTANLEIRQTGYGKGNLYIKDDIGPIKKIVRGGHPPGCKHAWRYTDPIEVPDGQITFDDNDVCENNDWEDLIHFKEFNLLSFYNLLARIQTEYFMNQLECSKPVKVSDEEMRLLEFLHEEVRNKFEHFMPKTYYVCTHTSLHAIQVCIQLSYKLLNESGNIFSHKAKELNTLLLKIEQMLTLPEKK